jgi:hypothetical protein
MSNKDLLKQAIAEAKTIREAAIANAKEALEESLTPHLKEMLAQKLQELDEVDEEVMDETPKKPERKNGTDSLDGTTNGDGGNRVMGEEDEEADEPEEAELDGEEEGEEGDDEEIDPNDPDFGKKLKELILQIVHQEGEHEEEETPGDEAAEEEHQDGESNEDTIDIEELLAELEGIDEDYGSEKAVDKSKEDTPYKSVSKTKTRTGGKFEYGEKAKPGKHGFSHSAVDKSELEEELAEAMSTIQTLRGQLQEVNLLNAKLLYVNKVFKSSNLTEGQKVNVIAAFDKAETVKEVKLVFETVSKNVVTKPATVKEHRSFASKPAGSTANQQIITEVSETVKRMQKLAGII